MSGGHYLGVALTAAIMFAGTNIDDAVALIAFNVAGRNTGLPTQRQIWIGQYLGMAVIVAVSGAAALGLRALPGEWVRFLGLVPMLLGIHFLVKAIRGRAGGDAPPGTAAGQWSAFAATVACGGDNVAVYTPEFRIMGPQALLLTLAVFTAGTALWCLAGQQLVSRPRVTPVLRAVGTWLVPVLFIGLGLGILGIGRETGVLALR